MAKKDAVGGIGITCDHDRCSTEKPTPRHGSIAQLHTTHLLPVHVQKSFRCSLQTHHELAVFVYPAACTQWRWWSAQRFYRWTINCVNNEPKKKCTVIGISESAGDSSIQWLNWNQCQLNATCVGAEPVWLYDVSVFTIASSSEQRRIVAILVIYGKFYRVNHKWTN